MQVFLNLCSILIDLSRYILSVRVLSKVITSLGYYYKSHLEINL